MATLKDPICTAIFCSAAKECGTIIIHVVYLKFCMISNSVKSIQCSPFCFSGVSVRQMLACLPSIQSSRLPHDSIQPLETSQREYVAQGKLDMPKTIKNGRTFAAFVLQHAGCSNSLGACPERTSCTLLSIVGSYGFRSVKPQMTCLVRQLAGGLLLVLPFVCVKSIMRARTILYFKVSHVLSWCGATNHHSSIIILTITRFVTICVTINRLVSAESRAAEIDLTWHRGS